MSTLGFEFNPQQVMPEEAGSFTVVPAGDYPAIYKSDEKKNTKANNGNQMLVVKLSLADGQFKGTEIQDNLNVINRNEVAQRIARGTLSAYAAATGYTQPFGDTTVLYGRPLVVRLTVEEYDKNDGSKGHRNTVEKRMSVAHWNAENQQVANSAASGNQGMNSQPINHQSGNGQTFVQQDQAQGQGQFQNQGSGDSAWG